MNNPTLKPVDGCVEKLIDGVPTMVPKERYLPREIKEIVKENILLKAQIKAQDERSEFVEDCIAEMASVLYA